MIGHPVILFSGVSMARNCFSCQRCDIAKEHQMVLDSGKAQGNFHVLLVFDE